MKQEKKNSRVRLILVMIVLLAALLAAIFLTDPGGEKTESIQAVMKDAVLHEAIARWAKLATTSAHGAAMRRRSRCGR